MIALAIAAPPSSHFIFIPVVLLLGIVIGFMMGSRATRDAFRLEQRKAADVVLVAMAEHQCVDRADSVDFRKQAGRRAFAEIEHQPLAGGFEEKAGRPLGADAGNQP